MLVNPLDENADNSIRCIFEPFSNTTNFYWPETFHECAVDDFNREWNPQTITVLIKPNQERSRWSFDHPVLHCDFMKARYFPKRNIVLCQGWLNAEFEPYLHNPKPPRSPSPIDRSINVLCSEIFIYSHSTWIGDSKVRRSENGRVPTDQRNHSIKINIAHQETLRVFAKFVKDSIRMKGWGI
jgi:hypothetical protein